MIILDTNVVSELMRPVPHPDVERWLSSQDRVPLATTVITVSEIIFGLHRLVDGQRRAALLARLEAFIGTTDGLAILPLDEAAARAAGTFRAYREKSGLSAPPSDMMIAGIAGTIGARLATRNVKDFAGLPIEIINPWLATG